MTGTLAWDDDGEPFSPRYGDRYRSHAGGLAQARQVFLAGNGLPGAWRGRPHFTILETGFGLGLNFLAAWQAWQRDPQRPQRLYFLSVEAHPVTPQDIRRGAATWPELAPLADELARAWWGLTTGVHRLTFEGGCVMLTLAVGDVMAALKALPGQADALFLDGFAPQRNPQMWTPQVMKALARHARIGTTIATWTVARAVRDALGEAGFVTEKAAGLAPKRDRLQGRYDPPWGVRRRPAASTQASPGEASGSVIAAATATPTAAAHGARTPHAAIIGAGLAGAAVADALARRGWRVTVYERGQTPASGASGLPAGLMAAHVAGQDMPLSQLTRAGIRWMLGALADLHAQGRLPAEAFGVTGALQRLRHRHMPAALRGERADGADGWGDWFEPRARTAGSDSVGASPDSKEATESDLWHPRAAWVRPAALVRAWLTHPGITVRLNAPVAPGDWPQADAVIVAAAHDSAALCAGDSGDVPWRTPLNRLAGQVAMGPWTAALAGALPAHPINGDGHLIPGIPSAPVGGPQPTEPRGDPVTTADASRFWMAGSTYERGEPMPPADAVAANLRRAGGLADANARERVKAELATQAEAGQVRHWAGVRATTADRLPLVGCVGVVGTRAGATPSGSAALWICAGMGSRGLSLAGLCGELLAARLCGEPLPVSAALAARLEPRFTGDNEKKRP